MIYYTVSVVGDKIKIRLDNERSYDSAEATATAFMAREFADALTRAAEVLEKKEKENEK
jgi:hypothetical protein